MLLDARAVERIDGVRIRMFRALNYQPEVRRDERLARVAKKLGIEVALFSPEGAWVAGEIRHPPPAVLDKIQKLPLMWMVPPDPEETSNATQFSLAKMQWKQMLSSGFQKGAGYTGAPPPFFVRFETSYWIGVRMPPIHTKGNPEPVAYCLLMASDSFRFGGLVLDVAPLLLSVLVLLGSALFWIPLVRSITQPVSAMERAAVALAGGDFSARVSEERGDELGRLARTLNTLAAGLQQRLESKRQFVVDVAHELGSPLARMQWSMDVLQRQMDDRQKAVLLDLREEVDLMVHLVEDLLRFYRSTTVEIPTQETVCIQALIQSAADQEHVPAHGLNTQGLLPCSVRANTNLLRRAVGNVFRNCLRYAPDSGPIRVSSERSGPRITVHITDNGPGVAPELISRLGEPFFRVDSHRARETGGNGLGLSIAKRCVEACEGSVQIANATPSGLRVSLTLPAAAPAGGLDLIKNRFSLRFRNPRAR